MKKCSENIAKKRKNASNLHCPSFHSVKADPTSSAKYNLLSANFLHMEESSKQLVNNLNAMHK